MAEENDDSINSSTGEGSGHSSETQDYEFTQAVVACSPMTSLLKIAEEDYRPYVVDQNGGLSGNETLHQFPCALFKDKKLLVWLADTELTYFSKSTFMNLCDFAERELKASSIVFCLAAAHPQKSQYRSMFKVIDAIRLSSGVVQQTFELESKAVAREICDETTLYELDL